MQTIFNRRLQHALQEAGDMLTLEREVDHHAYFESEEIAKSAANALSQQGFRVDPPQRTEDRVRLEFHRSDACDGSRPNLFVFDILDVIEPFGGDYGGWGSAVQKG